MSEKKRRRRLPESEDGLMDIAVRYLERFPTSEARLRRHLAGKVRDSVDEGRVTAEASAGWLDAVVARLTQSRLLDDRLYAESRARALMRRGKAERFIRRDLWQKGLSEADVDAAVGALREEADDPELAAACALARRRRMGPWCEPEHRGDRRDKHLAGLARAGFSFDVARRVVDAETVEELVEGG